MEVFALILVVALSVGAAWVFRKDSIAATARHDAEMEKQRKLTEAVVKALNDESRNTIKVMHDRLDRVTFEREQLLMQVVSAQHAPQSAPRFTPPPQNGEAERRGPVSPAVESNGMED